MSRLAIFTKREQEKFDCPPILNKNDRSTTFLLTDEIKALIHGMRKDVNKIGFIIQVGYFRANGKFFKPEQYRQQDIDYLLNSLSLPSFGIVIEKYATKSRLAHQKLILKLLGWYAFDDKEKFKLQKEIDRHVKQQQHPKKLMHIAINYLIVNKVMLPSYYCLADLITESYNKFEHKLLTIIKDKLTGEHVNILDALLSNKIDSGNSPSLHLMKKLIHSLKPQDITASVEMFDLVKCNYFQFQPLITELNLSQQAIEYYSTWLKKASLHQLTQFKTKHKSYLYILAFIQHQFYYQHDMLVDILLKSVQSSTNQAVKKTNKLSGSLRKERQELVLKLTDCQKNSDKLISDISCLAKSNSISDSNKIEEINNLILNYKNSSTSIETKELQKLEKYIEGNSEQYLDYLAEGSNKLQRRVSPILKALEFNQSTSTCSLFDAIEYFKDKSGRLTKSAPLDFLNALEIKQVKDGFCRKV